MRVAVAGRLSDLNARGWSALLPGRAAVPAVFEKTARSPILAMLSSYFLIFLFLWHNLNCPFNLLPRLGSSATS
jgi:hypothetical protein